jgi:phage-related protein
MAGTAELAILIRAKDEASGAMGKIGDSAGGLGSKLGALAVAAGAAAASFVSLKAANDAISYTEQLGDAVNKMRRETGLTAEESSQLIFAFHHVGLTGDDASRSIGIFAKKLKGISDEETGVTTGGKSMAQILGDVGVQATDANGNILPISDLLPQLADTFKAMPDGMEKTGLAMQLFGRSGKDMIPLLNLGSQGLADLSAEADKLGVTLSAENADAIKKYILAHRDMEAAIGGVKLQIGMALMPVLTRFGEWFVSVQPQIREFVKEGIEKVKAAIEALKPIAEALWKNFRTGIETIYPPIQAFVKFIVDNKPVLIAAITAIGAAILVAMGPGTTAVLAILGIITLVGLLRDHWDEIKAKTLEVWDGISDFLNEKFGFLRGLFETAFGAIKRYVEFVWTDIKAIFQAALDTIKNAFGFWKDVFSGDWEGAWNHVKEQFGIIWDLIKGLFENRLNLIRDVFDTAKEKVMEVAQKLGQELVDFFTELPGRIKDALGDLVGLLVDKGHDVITGLWNGMKWLFETEVTGWLNLGQKILDIIGDLGTLLLDVGKSVLRGLLDGMKWLWDMEIKGWLIIGQKILDIIGDLGHLLWDTGKAIMEGLLGGLKAAWEDVADFVGGIAGKIKGLKGPLPKDLALLYEPGRAIIQGLGAGMKAEWPNIASMLGGFTYQLGGGTVRPLALQVAAPTIGNAYSARESRQIAAGATYHFHGDIILPGVREPADFAQGLYRALRLRGHTP